MQLDAHSTLLASFSGAIAYLCVKGKMPAVQAVGSVIAGTAAAYYIAPGFVEYLEVKQVVLGERASAATTFLVGVGGIWILNVVISFLQALQRRSDDFVGRLGDRFLGPRSPVPPPPAPLSNPSDEKFKGLP